MSQPKKNTNSNVPPLRFPGFTDQWQSAPIGELFKISVGGDIDKEHVSLHRSKEFPYPILANALENDGIYGYSDIYKIKPNCLTVTGRGKVGVAKARFCEFYPIVRLMVLQSEESRDFIFFENAINSIRLYDESTGVPQLTAPQLAKYRVSFPEYNEQQKIGEIFSILDRRIATQRKIIEELESCNLQIIRDIVSSLKGYSVKPLGEIAEITNGDGDVQDAVLEHNDNLYPFFDRSEQIKYLQEYSFDTEAIIYPGEGQSFMPRYYNGKFALHQRCYAITNFGQEVLAKYCYYFMKTLNSYFVRTAVGSTVPSLRMDNFQKAAIIYPNIETQKHICKLLDSLGTKIRHEQEYLTLLNKQRQHMLSKMFI